MPVPSLPAALFTWTSFARMTPPQPFSSFIRTTGYRLRPPRPLPHAATVTRFRDAVLAEGNAEPRQLATLLCERRPGDRPTIVLGGFVPDATEQVFLMRSLLLKSGSVYYFNYPPGGFSLDLLCAQIDDLVEELTLRRGVRPIVFSVSFGGGLLIEWMRRVRAAGRRPEVAGVVLVSPVACAADVVDPAKPKAATLVGRAVKPYFDRGDSMDSASIERSRAIFAKMFESGVHNREAIRALMSAAESARLRQNVLATIRRIDFAGACERVRALGRLEEPGAWIGAPGLPPLCDAPALILYAENEASVITGNSPTRLALEEGHPALFPRGECRIVTGGASPVQHGSLIFHYYQFLPHVARFYRGLKTGKFRMAA